MKKILKIIGLLFLLIIIFRRPVYKEAVKYTVIQTRDCIPITNLNLLNSIEYRAFTKDMNLDKIIENASTITREELSFTFRETSSDPNVIIDTNVANCVGYSAMFNSIANHLIEKNYLEEKYTAVHQVGLLTFLGKSIHPYFVGEFFRDHDFNTVKNMETGEVISIDPSLNDYFRISEVSISSSSS